MLTIDVRVDTFEAASLTFGRRLAPKLDALYAEVTDALRACSAMAGSDESGRTWAASYDSASEQVAGLIAGLADGCTQLAALLEQTGFNHGLAESHSDPTRTVATPPDRTHYVVMTGGNVCRASLPSAAGGSGGGPFGWNLIQHAVGYAWPNGDPGALRRAAHAWDQANTRLRELAALVDIGVDSIAHQTSPEVPRATTVCLSMRAHITDTAAACAGLAGACHALASHIEQAHSELEHELASLAAWTVGTEATGAVLGAVTFGGGEVAAQGVEAARIAKVAARVAEILRVMSASVSALLDAIALSVARAALVATRLQLILGARVSAAVTTLVERLPADARERGSIELGRNARAEAESLADLTAASSAQRVDQMLKSARAGRGFYSVGSGTREQAMKAGRAWVGKGARSYKRGTVWVSRDGLRQFRVPTLKKWSGRWQANLEARSIPSGNWPDNGHIDIID